MYLVSFTNTYRDVRNWYFQISKNMEFFIKWDNILKKVDTEYVLYTCSAGLDKFNISMHWFLCTLNSSARMFMHAKLCVHKTVTVGANLHHLILQFANCHCFPYKFWYQLTLINEIYSFTSYLIVVATV